MSDDVDRRDATDAQSDSLNWLWQCSRRTHTQFTLTICEVPPINRLQLTDGPVFWMVVASGSRDSLALSLRFQSCRLPRVPLDAYSWY